MIDKALQSYLSSVISDVRIFYSRITPDPDTAIFIIPYGGKSPEIQDNYSYVSFQVISRSLLADNAEQNSARVFSLLQNVKNITIQNVEIIEITALHYFYQLKIDERNRVVYVQNFEAHMYDPTAHRI